MLEKITSIIKRFPRAAWGILISACFAYCLIACCATAFGLPYETMALIKWILAVALVASLINAYDELFYGWLFVFALALFVMYRNDYAVRESFWYFYNLLWEQLSRAYTAVAPYGSPYVIPKADCTKVFMLLGTFPAVAASWTSIKGRTAAWSVASAFPFLYISTCVTDRQPDARYFVLALSLLFYMVLSCSLRKREVYVHACLVGLVAFLALDVVFFLKPSSYVRSEKAMGIYYQLRDYSRSQGWLVSSPGSSDADPGNANGDGTQENTQLSPLGKESWDSSLVYSDLTKVGPRNMSYRHVMDISADENKVFYLRGYSYAKYENNAWMNDANAPSPPMEEGIFMGRGDTDGVLTVRTVNPSSILYVPYVPVDTSLGYRETDRYIANPGRVTEYTIPYSNTLQTVVSSGYSEYVREQYLQVPEETAARLAPDVAQIQSLIAMEKQETVNATMRYVKSTASYSRETEAVPEGRDFVDWFLHDSDTGDCVHFATAGVLLLRMQGVPARYVVGFMAYKGRAEISPIYEKDAHAWIEWYDNENGWQMIDATPSVNERDKQETRETPPPQAEEYEPTPETPRKQEETVVETQEEKKPFVIPRIVYVILWYAVYQAAVCAARHALLEMCDDKEKILRRYRIARRLDKQNAKKMSSAAQRTRFSNQGLSEKRLKKALGIYEEIYGAYLRKHWYWIPVLPLYRKKTK